MATAVQYAKEFVEGPAVPEAVKRLLEAFPLAKLCEALGSAEAADREVLITALERLAGFDEVCSGFLGNDTTAVFLRQGARSGNPRLVSVTARLLERLASSEAGAGVLASAGLHEELELLLLDEEIGTSEAAARSICRAATRSASKHVVMGGEGLVQRLQSRLQSVPETQQIRILSLFVELGRMSDVFPELVTSGALNSVLAAFLTDDILLKLNAVELMDALGSYQAGQEFLCKNGVPERLAADLTNPMCDDFVKLLVVRLLSLVLLRDPSLIGTLLPNQQVPFAQVLSGFLDSRNPTERLCALQAFENIAANQSGLEFFLQWPTFLRTVVSLSAAAQNDICKAAMSVWSGVLGRHLRKDANATSSAEIWRIAEDQVLPSALQNLSQKPFADMRIDTWKLLAVFASSEAAARKMLVADDMREKLLDFSSDTASDAKLAKHEFVQALVQNQASWLASFLDENIEKMLVEYAKRGPFWMPQVAKAQVTDGGSL